MAWLNVCGILYKCQDSCMCCSDGAASECWSTTLHFSLTAYPGSPQNAKASSSASVKKQEPLWEEKRRAAGHSHCVTKRGGKWKESYIALLLLLLGTGTQDCQLFAPPWTFLIKEHFGKPKKISTDHTDIHHAESPRDQGMVTGPGLPKLKERLDNALRHRVILLGCLCKASWNP